MTLDCIWFHPMVFDVIWSPQIQSDSIQYHLVHSCVVSRYQNISYNPILSNLISFNINPFIPISSSHRIAFSVFWWLHDLAFHNIWSYLISTKLTPSPLITPDYTGYNLISSDLDESLPLENANIKAFPKKLSSLAPQKPVDHQSGHWQNDLNCSRNP